MSTRSRGGALGLAIAALVGADALWLALARPDFERVAAFQSAAGGLGLGPAVGVASSFHGFDPRLEASCENELVPLPGLSCPNPYHGATLIDPAPLEPRRK